MKSNAETEQRNTKGQETETKQKETKELTFKELREQAKEREIEGYSNMKKAELIEALKE